MRGLVRGLEPTCRRRLGRFEAPHVYACILYTQDRRGCLRMRLRLLSLLAKVFVYLMGSDQPREGRYVWSCRLPQERVPPK